MEKDVEQEPFEELKEKRASRKEKEAAGRKTVIFLILITIVLSLFFWLKKEIPDLLKQIIKPYEVTVGPP